MCIRDREAEGLRHAGLHPDLVGLDVAELAEHLLDQVVAAGAHPTAGDQQVGVDQRTLEGLLQRPAVVADDRVAVHGRAGVACERRQGVAAGVAYLAGASCASGSTTSSPVAITTT